MNKFRLELITPGLLVLLLSTCGKYQSKNEALKACRDWITENHEVFYDTDKGTTRTRLFIRRCRSGDGKILGLEMKAKILEEQIKQARIEETEDGPYTDSTFYEIKKRFRYD